MYEEQFKGADDLGVTPLGSGSDYTVFLQHIGVRAYTRGVSGFLLLTEFAIDCEHQRRLRFDPS